MIKVTAMPGPTSMSIPRQGLVADVAEYDAEQRNGHWRQTQD